MGKELSEMSLKELWELFPIILKEHNPAYKEWYLCEKGRIVNASGGNNIKRISHIGSSAIEGLITKPTVDILLEINCNCDIEQIKYKLINSGWTLMSYESKPDLKMSFNKGYTPNGFAEKVFHLHVRFYGDWNELYFRDYLLIHKEVAEEYGRLKQELKEQYKHNRDGYTTAKTEFIMKYTKIAREEFIGRYL
ncbi:Glutamate-rich protein grpB [Desulfosporosinus sp. I2]|uniref:GrpB family protein n=1 Tax=Desulfosporosinus sp. I2 TaxID=1617025 RepID=UPI0005EE4813|nr:GrpB family protein [Desulfosporosinus sp. I2]KJR44515.1 Glutamate-rich protein grpB [Desulfosporosinus sp. I2]